MPTIELSGSLGLIAMVILTINVFLGMMLSTAYKKQNWWKKLPEKIKEWSINDIHNYSAYLALLMVLLHVVLIPLDPASKFTWSDIFFPTHAPHQSNIVLLGSISLLAILIVIITTQKLIKRNLSFRIWKNIHLISYGTAILFIIHGLMMDPELKDRAVDWIDPEKLLAELCALILIIAVFLRMQYHFASRKK
jgi:amino acid transporter